MLNKIQWILFEIAIFFIFSVKGLFATVLFSDDFNERDNLKWKFQDNGGIILINDGVMNLSSTEMGFPFISNSEIKKFDIFENAVLEFSFNYRQVGYMGNGIGIGYTGDNNNPYYQFSIWNDLDKGPMFQYRNYEVSSDGSCNYDSAPFLKFSINELINNNVWHIFRIEKYDRKYKIFVDNIEIFTTDDNQCIPQNIFIGNPLQGGMKDWTKLSIDYVKMSTDTTQKRNVIVILPGLGASWNPEAILLNTTVPGPSWTMTPFVKNYDLLIGALESNGLIRNQDFYVWNYDWRKPLSQIVDDFNSYINGISLQPGQKVDLVGHSLGGLVARIWSQDHNEKVGKAISLGSPHYGSLLAYEAWNGAKLGDNLDAAKIALNVLLQLQKKNKDTLVDTLRSYAPVISDLLPTFSFLKRNGSEITADKSQYLVDKNNSVTSITGQLSTIDGVGVNTKEWINLGERSIFDKVLGIWKEGRPSSYLYGAGDGTVLKKSALISDAEGVDFNSDHGAIVDKSTNWVLTKLALGITINSTSNYPTKAAIFYLGSPASMVVNCGGVEKGDVGGFVVIENKEISDCVVKLTGKDGGGIYHLVMGDNKEWKYFEGEINNNQVIKILEKPVSDSWQILRKDFEAIGANLALKAAKKEDIMEAVNAYMLFRLTKENFKYSEDILENLKLILTKKKVSNLENSLTYYLAEWQKSLVEKRMELMKKKNIEPSYAAALNFNQANGLLKPGLNYAQNLLAQRLFFIVWK